MSDSVFPLRLTWHERLADAGGEAMLPAGSRLADAGRTGRHCFLLVEGSAVVEKDGQQAEPLPEGTFVGSADGEGLPQPPAGVTVRLVTPARVLVLDKDRLAALIDSEPVIADLWRSTIDRGSGLP
ncbi:MAG TPA: cyclic nucleotide-binding domain-containing protein [Streptosporangiaceae bacterium]|nr:cyclic nucleotide-binding domain-containing protein [Streptosporangiaceae bacterium]